MSEPCPHCADLQRQIDQLERNCIEEFKWLAIHQQNRSLAPLINRIAVLEAVIAQGDTVTLSEARR